DNFCLVLKRGPQIQLVYKHSVATVVPAPEFKLFDNEEDDAEIEAV
ncbi:MAG: RNA chaperone Hfq, partial [Alphaproteobacteria bacterium]|nr:RNA chaperone Hfq [Alphaproteobacteria bacterium]